MDAKEAYAAKPWLEHYPEGVPAEVDVPDISVPQAFDSWRIGMQTRAP